MDVLFSIILGFVPSFFYALFVYWLDRYEKEPWLLVGAVFIWGAVVAAGGAFLLNTLFGMSVFIFTGSETFTDIATGSISAPLVEESLKGLAVLIVFLIFRREFDNLLDGVVYAGVAALGFAATENSFYIYQFGFAEGGIGEIAFITFVRNVLVGWQHPFYTAFIGIGLAIARLTPHLLIKLTAPAIGWGIAALTHSFHNTVAIFVNNLFGLTLSVLIDWTGWLFMFLFVLWAIARERNFIRQYLREEVRMGIITPRQYRTAASAWAASLARFEGLTSGRYRATNRFYQKCAELSHKKRQLEKFGDEDGNTARIESLRQELARLSPIAAGGA